ncbi:MAG: transcriptional repressor [Magnetococcales bacterium]|nr:transcriptional repressor [Magnetococcales bacterium]
MIIKDESPERRLDWLKSQLQQAGHKATHQRLEVFRQVILTDEHPDAEAVYLGVRERIPTISRNTVYQTLQFLMDQGFIAPFGVHQASHRYDPNPAPHHHLLCLRCGKVSDYEASPLEIIPPPMGGANWGKVDSIHVELRGVCSDCLSERKREP